MCNGIIWQTVMFFIPLYVQYSETFTATRGVCYINSDYVIDYKYYKAHTQKIDQKIENWLIVLHKIIVTACDELSYISIYVHQWIRIKSSRNVLLKSVLIWWMFSGIINPYFYLPCNKLLVLLCVLTRRNWNLHNWQTYIISVKAHCKNTFGCR